MIPLPEQAVHLELKDPSGSGSRDWVVMEEAVGAFRVDSLIFFVLVPEEFEYASRGNRLLISEA